MKRFYFLAASIGLLAACSGLEQPEQDLLMDDGEDLVEKIVFDVLPIKDGDDPGTRASAVPNGSTVNFAWEETDTVGIFPDKGSQAFFSMESGAGTSSASFDGGGWALKQGTSYISYYPLVGEFYLDRTKIPVSFVGQKQIGTSSPFHGARYYLATEPTSSENGVLRFSYSTLNTIINVNATLPAGTYTKASLTVSEPLFVEEGTYSLDEQTIVGKTYSNVLKIDLEDVTLTTQGVLPIYIMSAPVDLKNKEVTVMVISSDGKKYECVKTPSKAYEAGTRYGLTCDNMEQSNAGNIVFADANIKAALVAAFDTEGDGELSYMEAAAVTSIEGVFGTKKTYTSFDEFQYFTGVETIPSSMFEGWQISSIILPESVSGIGSYAFKDCVKLTSISIPNAVNYLNYYVFQGCSHLETITIPETMTGFDSGAFSNCSSLTSIIIPESVTSIGSSAFSGCSSLTSIVIPESVTSIGSTAFSGCSSLTSIVIPESVTSIGNNTFSGCSSLTSIIIPESVTSIGSRAFFDCSSLITISIPQDVYRIENYTFSGCSSLTSIIIPESVTSIGSRAFYGCGSLESVVLPQNIYRIEDYTFQGCSSLLSIDIPESVTSIGRNAFRDCSSLRSVIIPEGVTIIEQEVFFHCGSLSNIYIPESVTSIGADAFADCSSLTSVDFPDALNSIGVEAFAGCSGLTSVIIPESVTSIGDIAFMGCNGLTSFVCLAEVPPSSVTYLTFYQTDYFPIYVPSGSVSAYKSADGWSYYADRIQSVEGGDVPPVDDGGDD